MRSAIVGIYLLLDVIEEFLIRPFLSCLLIEEQPSSFLAGIGAGDYDLRILILYFVLILEVDIIHIDLRHFLLLIFHQIGEAHPVSGIEHDVVHDELISFWRIPVYGDVSAVSFREDQRRDPVLVILGYLPRSFQDIEIGELGIFFRYECRLDCDLVAVVEYSSVEILIFLIDACCIVAFVDRQIIDLVRIHYLVDRRGSQWILHILQLRRSFRYIIIEILCEIFDIIDALILERFQLRLGIIARIHSFFIHFLLYAFFRCHCIVPVYEALVLDAPVAIYPHTETLDDIIIGLLSLIPSSITGANDGREIIRAS